METIARLGEGVQKKGILSQEAMTRGFQTLSQYMQRCRSMGVERVFAVGTSALRDASNAYDFLRMIEQQLALTIDIISGEEEALFSFLAVVRDLGGSDNSSILVVDVGGGSTEFILGKGERVCGWVSLPLGAVRFTEQFLLSDPVREEEWQRMEKAIRERLSQIPRAGEPVTMIAVGGTATTLASVEQGLNDFIVEKIHHFHLTREALKINCTSIDPKPSKNARTYRDLPRRVRTSSRRGVRSSRWRWRSSSALPCWSVATV